MLYCCNKKESGFKRQHRQRIVRNVLLISSNKTAIFFFSNFSVPGGTRERSQRENVSPQKRKEVKERERGDIYAESEPPLSHPKVQRKLLPPHRIIAGHYMYTTVSNISRNIQY